MLDGIPLGHSIASHLTHGWCAVCPDRDPTQEVVAWRVWAGQHMPVVAKAVGRADKQ